VCRQCFIGNKKLLDALCPLWQICPSCDSVFRKGRWQSGGREEDIVISLVKENLEINRDATSVEMALTPKQLDYSRYRIHVRQEPKSKVHP